MYRSNPWGGGAHPSDDARSIQTTVDPEKIFEVIIKECVVMIDDWEREPPCKLLRYTHCTNVDPQDRLRGVVRPFTQPRLDLPCGIEARAKGGDN